MSITDLWDVSVHSRPVPGLYTVFLQLLQLQTEIEGLLKVVVLLGSQCLKDDGYLLTSGLFTAHLKPLTVGLFKGDRKACLWQIGPEFIWVTL